MSLITVDGPLDTPTSILQFCFSNLIGRLVAGLPLLGQSGGFGDRLALIEAATPALAGGADDMDMASIPRQPGVVVCEVFLAPFKRKEGSAGAAAS